VIVNTLTQFQGHRQRTARALGIGVRTLGLKLRKWKEQQLVAESL
jgi:DNA-binding NtrC family response regulator